MRFSKIRKKIWLISLIFVLNCIYLFPIGADLEPIYSITSDLSPSDFWPVENPKITGDYSAFNEIGNGKYHTGIDMISNNYIPNNYDTPVKAVADGIVLKIFRVKTSLTTCKGSVLIASTNTHRMGNSVIIQHSNEKFTFYGHLHCINDGITPGVSVSQGQVLGIMGNSDTSAPHLHFEYKEFGVLGDVSDDCCFWGYTPDAPDKYHYYNPRLICSSSFLNSTITVTPLSVFKGKTIIYSLEKKPDWGLLIDPIVFLENGNLQPLPKEISDDRTNASLLKSFNNEFYFKNREYFIIRNGIMKGRIRVTKPKEISGCFSLTSGVELFLTENVTGEVMALASNSSEFLDTKFERKSPSDLEMKIALDIALNYYSKKNISANLLKKTEPLGVAIYENRKGAELLISSFDISSDQKIGELSDGNHKAFFYIIEYNNNVPISKFAWYNDGNDADIAFQELVDIIDLDADGFPEVITKCQYYESWTYMIYKKQDQKWIKIYEGGGGGC